MFDRLFHGFDLTLPTAGWKADLSAWQEEGQFHVEVELPGIPQDAVDITVQDRQLVIAYERKVMENRQFTYNERQFGRFERRLSLPDSVDVNSVKAELRDGLLHITMSRTPESQPRRIAVETS